MPDPGNPFAMNQQEALLREIRDELKTGRQVAAGASAGAGSRPSPSFIAAQQTTDRMVAGEWANMGWANAYQTSIKSSLANDLMGAMGMRAGPQSMWQHEYEVMSKSMMTDRIVGFGADLVMPGFGRRSRDMGAQMYQMSSRFNRTGDNLATNFDQTMAMGREMQIGAARDMRLSGGDYSTIMQNSAQAGQFDFANGLGDVKNQFNDLKAAVADLTKSMRLGAGEVSQTLGAFRQFGIVDVADQKRMAERLSYTARTAGISTPEMAGITRSGIEAGLALGLGAEGSAALAQNLAMAARGSSRTGLISGNVMAQAGGVQGMVQAQQNAINQFAGSAAGYYTALGAGAGSTGGALEDMIAGIGATGGTMGGIVAAEARRIDFMSTQSGGQRQRMFNRNLSQQMQMIGVDPNSAEATDYAFTMVRGQMGDAAGLAYARQNFSAEGRRQRWGDAYRTELGAVNMDAQRTYQRRMENESMLGRFRQATGELGAGVAELGMWGGRQLGKMSRGFGGTFDWGNSTFGNAAEQLGLNGDDALSAESAVGAAFAARRSEGAGNSRENAISLMGSVSSGSGFWSSAGLAVGGFAGWKAGAWGGAKLGAMIGTAFGPGLGTGIGAIAGGLIGAGVGYVSAKALTSYGGVQQLTGDEATSYMSAFRGASGKISDRAVNIASGQSADALRNLSNSQAFQGLLKKYTNGGKLSDEDSRALAKEAKAAASESGLTEEDVVGAARAMGADIQMQDSYNSAASGAKRYEATMVSVMEGVESSKLSIASAEVATGVSAYASAKNSTERNKARSQLAAAGINGRGMDNLVTELDGLDQAARNQVAQDAGDYVSRRGSSALNKRYTAFNNQVSNLAGEAMGMSQAGGREAYERIQELKKDPQALMEVMMGGGEAKDAALRDFLIRQDDTGTLSKLKELGSIDDLMASSADDRFLKITGMEPEKLKQMRDAAMNLKDASLAQRSAAMKTGAAAMILLGSQMMKRASDPVNIAANNMLLAANILREIQGNISNKTSTKSGS